MSRFYLLLFIFFHSQSSRFPFNIISPQLEELPLTFLVKQILWWQILSFHLKMSLFCLEKYIQWLSSLADNSSFWAFLCSIVFWPLWFLVRNLQSLTSLVYIMCHFLWLFWIYIYIYAEIDYIYIYISIFLSLYIVFCFCPFDYYLLVFCELVLLGIHWYFWICVSISFTKCGKFSPLFLQILFLH